VACKEISEGTYPEESAYSSISKCKKQIAKLKISDFSD
jgi:hypothetical protein